MGQGPLFDTAAFRRIAEGIEIEEAAEDRSVAVRMGPNHRVDEISLSSRALRKGTDELSETILRLIREAGTEADAENRRAVSELFDDRETEWRR
ncbi:YbaB/EbfC family nucleoid-associated protein [Salininema proteolyticum]|uniref:YbaB/EbfC family nucleoid-associated protein n=1 Tax=Salininema proteolyticum TaxID=1607685 RepID=A0ABV8TTI1_9ACTN